MKNLFPNRNESKKIKIHPFYPQTHIEDHDVDDAVAGSALFEFLLHLMCI